MNAPLIIAFIGKGGVGKTVLSALTGKLFMELGRKVLFIDADPAMGLAASIGAENFKTIGRAREEIIKRARIASTIEEKERLGEVLDYVLLETLYERPGYSLIVMGQTDTLGCYCPVNGLLRRTIGALASNYDAVIIDAEAGIEQVNRQVVESVQYPVIVTDNSLRGVKTALMINGRIGDIPSMKPVQTGVIFNRVESPDPDLVGTVTAGGMLDYEHIGPDPDIREFDLRGTPLIDMPPDASVPRKLRKILSANGILK
ncbi:MAG TPA: AAA family ATPase [Spirochaetota bacterium]|nr:AAA family ATPase [Spirochaetota bacterium]HRZ25519.1 AAA family ATPase [Spirochaetota bacterium]